jgi:sugar (pentulose or hexulose) kinase
VVPETEELACKGAAMLCAVGTTCFSSLDEAIEKQVRSKEIIFPVHENMEIYQEWYQKIINNYI